MAKFKVGDRFVTKFNSLGTIINREHMHYEVKWDDVAVTCSYPTDWFDDYHSRNGTLVTGMPYAHPGYYLDGREYEPFKVINDWDLSYALGCVIKYVARAGRKTNDPIPDLEKARNYLNMEIERLKNG